MKTRVKPETRHLLSFQLSPEEGTVITFKPFHIPSQKKSHDMKNHRQYETLSSAGIAKKKKKKSGS